MEGGHAGRQSFGLCLMLAEPVDEAGWQGRGCALEAEVLPELGRKLRNDFLSSAVSALGVWGRRGGGWEAAVPSPCVCGSPLSLEMVAGLALPSGDGWLQQGACL